MYIDIVSQSNYIVNIFFNVSEFLVWIVSKALFMVDGLFTTPTYRALNVKLIDGISDHMAIVAEINKV